MNRGPIYITSWGHGRLILQDSRDHPGETNTRLSFSRPWHCSRVVNVLRPTLTIQQFTLNALLHKHKGQISSSRCPAFIPSSSRFLHYPSTPLFFIINFPLVIFGKLLSFLSAAGYLKFFLLHQKTKKSLINLFFIIYLLSKFELGQ